MPNKNKSKAIAVIGMSCRFPGASSVREFYDLLAFGKSSFSDIPPSRKDQFDFSGVKHTRASFLDNSFHFDNEYFKIPEEEALSMDPQQRLILELAEESKIDAGLSGQLNKNTAVYIGANQRSYAEAYNAFFERNKVLEAVKDIPNFSKIDENVRNQIFLQIDQIKKGPEINSFTLTGNITNMIASRISHQLNLSGPSLTVDTACSSALVALHMACEAIQSGKSEMALAGAINLNLSSSIFRVMEAAGVISNNESCVPFSECSDGILLGEGGGVLLLKPYDQAIRDENSIYAIIRGSGINNDGKTLGIMAPSWKGQLRLLQETYRNAEIDPSLIGMIEAHGTSTRIGDSVEITVLKKFFESNDSNLSIGSVKSNLGHLLSASGIAGIIKAIISLHKKQLFPSLTEGKINPKWSLQETSFHIQSKLENWNQKGLRYAGVSSFGFGGTNAHVIVQEADKNKHCNLDFDGPKFHRKFFNYVLYPGLQKDTKYFYESQLEETNVSLTKITYKLDHWLVFTHDPDQAVLEPISKSLEKSIIISHSSVFTRLKANRYTIDFANKEHFEWLVEGYKGAEIGIIYISPRQEAEERVHFRSIKFLLEIIDSSNQVKAFQAFTNNAYSLHGDSDLSPLNRSIHVLLNSALNECKYISRLLVDLEVNETGKCINLLTYEADQSFILRNEKHYVPRLRSKNEIPPIQAESRGKTYLILGGSTGIGLEIAKYYSKDPTANIIHTGRRSRDDFYSDSLELEDNLIYQECDVLEFEELKETVENTLSKYNQIESIIFAAGQISWGLTSKMSLKSFESILRTKIIGAKNLSKLDWKDKVRNVYFISSISELSVDWGFGLAAYGAANAYLDVLSQKMTNAHTHWQSVNWTIWLNTGMSKGLTFDGIQQVFGIHKSKAIQLFVETTRFKSKSLVVIDPLDVERFSPFWKKNPKPVSKTTVPERIVENKTEIAKITESLDFKSELKRLLALAVELPISEISNSDSFTDLGLDSILALDIVDEIEKKFDVVFHPTLLYEYDSIDRLTEYYLSSKEMRQDDVKIEILDAQKTFYTNAIFYPNQACNCQVSVRFYTLLNHERLEKALVKLVQIHDSLNLQMAYDGHEPKLEKVISGNIRFHQKFADGDQDIDFASRELLEKIYDIEKAPLFDFAHFVANSGKSILLFNAHHLVTDAWSMAILIKDLLSIYEEPSISIPHTSLIAYHKHVVNSRNTDHINDCYKYWQQELEGFAPIDLKTIEDAEDYDGICIKEINLSVFEKQSIDHFIKKSNISLNDYFITCYAQSIQAFLDREDVIIRVADQNRDRRFDNVKALTGCFADSFPLRYAAPLKLDINDAGQVVREKIALAQKYKGLSSLDYAKIVNIRDQWGPKGISPFGYSFINLDYFLPKDSEIKEVKTQALLPFSGISMLGTVQNGHINLSWQYDQKVVSSEEIKLIVNHFKKALDKCLRTSPIYLKGLLPFVAPREKLFPKYRGIHEKIIAACEQYGHKKAIIEPKKSYSFLDILNSAQRISTIIAKQAIGVRNNIGILAYPGFDASTGIFGILFSGNTYVPLDPDWPEERIRMIGQDASLVAIITNRALYERILRHSKLSQEFKIYFFIVDDRFSNPRERTISLLENINFKSTSQIKYDEETPAYIMYTSGTTGKPKGVVAHHEAIAIFLDWLSEVFGFNGNDRFIATSSIGFGGSTRQMFSTLLAGAEMHPIDRYALKDPQTLLDFLVARRITILNTVPSVLFNLCEFVELTKNRNWARQLENLRLLLIGGEELKPDLVKRWKRNFGSQANMYNLYGSTETIVNATIYQVDFEKDYKDGIPLGSPRMGSQILLLNQKNKPCYAGEIGEVLVGGGSIASYYYNRTNLTNEKFIKLPGLDSRFYRTGDLAILKEDGLLYYCGRNDDQIQIGGNRVEPAEIERIVNDLPFVSRTCIVSSMRNKRQGLRLVIELKKGILPFSDQEIRKLLSYQLPMYMVPNEIVFVDKLPLTSAGKIDMKALRVTNQEKPSLSAKDLETQTEKIIKGIWQRVLNLTNIASDDDFFYLGGDSLSAIIVLQELRKTFLRTPIPSDLFQKRTLRSLAAHMQELNQGVDLLEGASESLPNSKSLLYPLSQAQKGFLLLAKMNKKSTNLLVTLPIKRELNPNIIRDALQQMVTKHDILRTKIIKVDGNYFQRISDENQIDFKYQDICDMNKLEQKEVIKKEIQHLESHYFDLENLPQFQVRYFKNTFKESTFIVSMHHVIGDGWSMVLMAQELEQLIENHEQKPVNIRMYPSYFSFVKKESELLEKNKESAAEFWRTMFKNLQPQVLPKNLEEGHHNHYEFIIPQQKKRALEKIAASVDLNLFHLIFSLYCKSLMKTFQQKQIVFNLSVSNREIDLIGITEMIGCIAKTIMFPVFNPEKSIIELAHNIKDRYLETLNHIQYPTQELLKHLSDKLDQPIKHLFKFPLSYMDFKALLPRNGESSILSWSDAQYYFDSSNADVLLMTGFRVFDDIKVTLSGKSQLGLMEILETEFNALIEKVIEENYKNIKEEQISIDAALISYFPSLNTLKSKWKRSFALPNFNRTLLDLILPAQKPSLLEIEEYKLGKSGTIFLPIFADEINAVPKVDLLTMTHQAIALAKEMKASCISLAGNLSSRLNYGFDVLDPTSQENTTAITTGHACTVVAVVKTLQKVLIELELHIENLSIAVVGFGSIGQASASLLFQKLGYPRKVYIVDKKVKIPAIRKVVNAFEEVGSDLFEIITVEKEIPSQIFEADIIIGASSSSDIIDIEDLKAGCVILDDSFPHLVNVPMAVRRMRLKEDVLVIGAGKLSLGPSKRRILNKDLQIKEVEAVIKSFGDEGLPGCRLESLLISKYPELPKTIGLVSTNSADIFWDLIENLEIKAVDFHLESFKITSRQLKKIREIKKQAYG
jgi:amino acid adenylation domain-containing protein